MKPTKGPRRPMETTRPRVSRRPAPERSPWQHPTYLPAGSRTWLFRTLSALGGTQHDRSGYTPSRSDLPSPLLRLGGRHLSPRGPAPSRPARRAPASQLPKHQRRSLAENYIAQRPVRPSNEAGTTFPRNLAVRTRTSEVLGALEILWRKVSDSGLHFPAGLEMCSRRQLAGHRQLSAGR